VISDRPVYLSERDGHMGLVVLSKDILMVPPTEIVKTKVLLTVMG